MTARHKVFVSYHHDADERYKLLFERLGVHFDTLVRGSVDRGDFEGPLPTETVMQRIRDEYLRDSSVTVVLIGANTWQRKFVDWELSASIRDTRASPRSGLLGLFLPTHPACGRKEYDQHTIPPRLHDNVECGYAKLFDWTEDPERMSTLIHEAYVRKNSILPTNSRRLFANNRSGSRWSD